MRISTPANIVVVHRYGGFGDLLLSTVVPSALRAAYPGVRVTFLCSSAGQTLLGRFPHIDETLVYPADMPLAAQAADLRARRFDVGIVLWSKAAEARLLAKAGIPVRVGQAGRLFYSFHYTHRVRVRSEHGDVSAHWTDILLDYVRILGMTPEPPVVRFPLTEEDTARAQALLAELGAGGEPLVAFHLGKGMPLTRERWPVEAFIDFARAIAGHTGLRLLLTGSTREAPLVGLVKEALGDRAVDAAGRADIGTLAGLLAGAKAMVCPDSFPMHLAASLGVPTVGIYALKADIVPRWRPLNTRYRVVRPADFACARLCVKEQCPDFACYRQVDPHEVALAVQDLLDGGGLLPDADPRTDPGYREAPTDRN